ncbi:MAG: glycosyltransferase family 39 protein [Anaerolineaceae bacterium]|nr:glycosyltransferase family 39 protein [Anaerolineaceae bacterium]
MKIFWYKNKRPLVFLAFFTWVILILTGYYWGHKPFDTSLLHKMFTPLLDMIIILGIIGTACGLGELVLRGNSSAGILFIRIALGLGILGIFWLLIGLAGGYTPWIAWFLFLFGLIFPIVYRKKWFSILKNNFEGISLTGWFEWTVFSAIVLLLLFQFLYALAVPYRYDALAYHLQIPRLFVAEQSFVFIPEIPYWGHPLLIEMLYTWSILLHRFETAALLGWVVGVMLLIGVFLITVKISASLRGEEVHREGISLNIKAGLVSVFALLAGYTFCNLLSAAYVDLFASFFGFCVLLCMINFLENNMMKWLVYSGILIGIAMSVKWTAGILLLGFTLFLLLRKRRSDISYKQIIIPVLSALVLVSPWLIKNLIVSGNPVFPYFFETQWFSTQRLTAASLASNHQSILSILVMPFKVLIEGFEGGRLFNTDMGPLLLLFLPLGLITYRKEKITHLIFCFIIFAWLAIGIGGSFFQWLLAPRLYFAILPFAALGAGLGFNAIKKKPWQGIRFEKIGQVVVLIVVVFVLLQEIKIINWRDPGKSLLGIELPEVYLQRNLGDYTSVMQEMKNLSEDQKVLFLWESRVLYAPLNSRADSWLDLWQTMYWELKEPKIILAHWRMQGFTHVLLHKRGVDFIKEDSSVLELAGWQTLDSMLELLASPVYLGDAYILYPLEP